MLTGNVGHVQRFFGLPQFRDLIAMQDGVIVASLQAAVPVRIMEAQGSASRLTFLVPMPQPDPSSGYGVEMSDILSTSELKALERNLVDSLSAREVPCQK